MKEEKMTLEISPHDVASCNICCAHNYDSPHDNIVGERVDRLYELRVGKQVMTLCDKCLNRLSAMLIQHTSQMTEGTLETAQVAHPGGSVD